MSNETPTTNKNDEETPPSSSRDVPIREISFPIDDDNNTLPSELSALITHHYQPLQGDNNLYGSSHRHSHPTGEQTSPTGDGSGNTQTSHISRKAFQFAAFLGFLSIGILLYADVVANMNSAAKNSQVEMDAWDAENPGVRGMIVESHDNGKKGSKNKTKASKNEKEGEAKKKGIDKKQDKDAHATKADKEVVAKGANDDDDSPVIDGDTNDEYQEPDTDDDNDEVFINPKRRAEPKLIPFDVISSATDNNDNKQKPDLKQMDIPIAKSRCPYVLQTFQQQNGGVTNMAFLREKYIAQSVDPNVFYRATALLFWKDFGAGHWGSDQHTSIDLDELVSLNEARYEDGTPLSPMSTWTWITGDQHLSNFGAWRNRGGEVVFSVNDFDEAAIFDFQVDVLRIAVSICNHGFTNGFSVDQVTEALEAFTYVYVKTAIDYVGGDTALVYELTADTSTGILRDFLSDVESKKSQIKQLGKFTEVGKDGVRRFMLNDVTRLEDVPKELEDKIRTEIASTRYGASMMKMGWKVRGWDDDFFTVLDVARRVGSGIGSYGVDRFYVLLKGEDTSTDEPDASVILDIKYEPTSAVSRVLDNDTKAWYSDMFKNEADRAAQAQRRLTSYTDPFVGWIELDGQPYNVRQRSPWKNSFELEQLTNYRAFEEFIEQIAVATATSVSKYSCFPLLQLLALYQQFTSYAFYLALS
eukprot:scaffold145_cov195-Alexandrium_tamarense.AAC.74